MIRTAHVIFGKTASNQDITGNSPKGNCDIRLHRWHATDDGLNGKENRRTATLHSRCGLLLMFSSACILYSNRMPCSFERRNSLRSLLPALVAVSLLCRCGTDWPPVAETKHNVDQLPASQRELRARGLPDGDIPALERLHELTNLDFYSGCAVEKAAITDEGLLRLSKLDLPHLNILALGFCDSITDDGLTYVAQMSTVRVLMMMGSPRITDEGLPKLMTMKSLVYLDLRGCPGITDRGLQYLVAKKDWGTILFGGSRNVTPEGVARLQAALRHANIQKDDQEWKLCTQGVNR